MYHTVSVLIHECSILKCIVPPTVPSVLSRKKGLNDKNAKCVDGCVNYCIMKHLSECGYCMLDLEYIFLKMCNHNHLKQDLNVSL